MNSKFTQVLLSISLASFISCAPSQQSTLERHKRSFYHPNSAHRFLAHLWVPGRHKDVHHGAVKRSGLSLDFIDSLLSEFGEEEPFDDQLPSNTMLHDPLPSNSLLHEPLSSKSLLHDPVSSNSLLHAPSLHDESLTREPMINEAHNQEKMLADVLAHEKDPMSNVIPGAEGPFHTENKLKPPTKQQQQVADHLMDDFLLFLSLKDLGMLDQCLAFYKRR